MYMLKFKQNFKGQGVQSVTFRTPGLPQKVSLICKLVNCVVCTFQLVCHYRTSLCGIVKVLDMFQRNMQLHNLKVLDQITLENQLCLNFKIRSVFINKQLIQIKKQNKKQTTDLYLVLKQQEKMTLMLFIVLLSVHTLLFI